MMINELFDFVETISKFLINDIAEISVRASDISIMFEGPVAIPMQDIVDLDTLWDNMFVTDITTFNEHMFVSYRQLTEDNFKYETQPPADIGCLYKTIKELQSRLCSCPALEFVVSSSYLKVFLDVPNLEVRNLAAVDELFKANGFLEINDVRPYILYIVAPDIADVTQAPMIAGD